MDSPALGSEWWCVMLNFFEMLLTLKERSETVAWTSLSGSKSLGQLKAMTISKKKMYREKGKYEYCCFGPCDFLAPDSWCLNIWGWLYLGLCTSSLSESSDCTPWPVALSYASPRTSGHVLAVTCWVGRGRCRAKEAASPWSHCTCEHKANGSAGAARNSSFDHTPALGKRNTLPSWHMVAFSRELQINRASAQELTAILCATTTARMWR